MLKFVVDEALCIRCGECAQDCPYGIIQIHDALPVVNPEKESLCVNCQHCLTVCQPGALSIHGIDPMQSISLQGHMPTPESVETLVMGRRSVRRYKDEAVDLGLIDRLVEVMRAAPTGKNNMETHFTVVDDVNVMTELRAKVYEGIESRVAAGTLPAGLEFFEGIARAWGKGVDIVFRGAPHLLVVSAPVGGPSPVADCLIALSYFELLANSHGLGTVWNGFAKWALFDVAPDVGSLLPVPQGYEVGYVLSFGVPAVKYHRTAQRKGGVVERLSF